MSNKVKEVGFDFWTNTLKKCQYVVAPMVDQSELAWRMLSRRYGAQLCYSPMYHSSVFIKDTQYRREALQTCPTDRPLIIQFCSNDPATFLEAAKLAEDHCDAIDLNLGCPQSIAKRGHYGAFLQDEWELLEKMVSTCHQHLKVPITCKIRIYESIDKTVEYAKTLERAGCQLLCVHGRTREMKGRLTGIADWEYVKAIKRAVNIPVFSNGNIQYLSDVKRCLAETGVDGVMTAEGNLHNPALFVGLSPPVWQMCEEYLELVKLYPCPLSFVRGHLFKILHHALHLHTDVRDMVSAASTPEDLGKAVEVLKERCLREMDDENFDPKQGLFGELPLPYWYCQPYVRPSPEEAEKNKGKRVNLKRPIEIEEMVAEKGLSKKKVKRLLRNPRKNFDKTERIEYKICENNTCDNIRCLTCTFNLCKGCCRTKTSVEEVWCVGKGHKWKKNQALQEREQNGTTPDADNLPDNLTSDTAIKSNHGEGRDTTPEGDKTIDVSSDSRLVSGEESTGKCDSVDSLQTSLQNCVSEKKVEDSSSDMDIL